MTGNEESALGGVWKAGGKQCSCSGRPFNWSVGLSVQLGEDHLSIPAGISPILETM